MHKLNPDQQEALADLRDSDGANVLLIEAQNRIVIMENDVLTLLLDGTNDSELVRRKLKVEGARKLYGDLVQILKKPVVNKKGPK